VTRGEEEERKKGTSEVEEEDDILGIEDDVFRVSLKMRGDLLRKLLVSIQKRGLYCEFLEFVRSRKKT
jgi:hypothetical protein